MTKYFTPLMDTLLFYVVFYYLKCIWHGPFGDVFQGGSWVFNPFLAAQAAIQTCKTREDVRSMTRSPTIVCFKALKSL